MTAAPTASTKPNTPLLLAFPSPTRLAASSHRRTLRCSKHWPRQ